MTTSQLVFTLALVAVLVGTAAFFLWRQLRTFREITSHSHLSSEERDHLRWRARLRLINCGLMLLLAGWLAGSLLLEDRAQQLADQSDMARARGEEFVLEPEDKPFVRFYGWYWISGLLALLLLVGIAGVDLLSVRRHARRQFKKLKEDHRTMLAEQTAMLRRNRNGES